ncbi:HET-6OR heterokaryon incompatibility protein (het-6OR allele) [Apiospora saccharicola]
MNLYTRVVLREKFQTRGTNLELLLTLCSQAKASDARDKVFALLGLANDEATREIVPDYSVSPCTVYCLAIQAIFKKLSKDWDPEKLNEKGIADVVNQTHHEALREDNSDARVDCDGMKCGSWRSCLEIASRSSHLPFF